jgi:hypothetical protein
MLKLVLAIVPGYLAMGSVEHGTKALWSVLQLYWTWTCTNFNFQLHNGDYSFGSRSLLNSVRKKFPVANQEPYQNPSDFSWISVVTKPDAKLAPMMYIGCPNEVIDFWLDQDII